MARSGVDQNRAGQSAPDGAWLLGLSGLIPFFAGVGAALLGEADLAEAGRRGLLLYGAIILSFMGGCRWGFAAAGLGARPLYDFALSVTPALFAFFLLLAESLAPQVGFAGAAGGLAIGFLALYASDVAATRRAAAPIWWPSLRLPLTLGAAGSLAVGALFAA